MYHEELGMMKQYVCGAFNNNNVSIIDLIKIYIQRWLHILLKSAGQ